jgi:hypothetical protein
MIAAWMLYCIGIGLALIVAGYAAERALYLAGRPTRWAWSVALLGTLLLPVAALLRPQAFGSITVPLAAPAPPTPTDATPVQTDEAVAPAPVSAHGLTWTDLDGALRWGWALSSVALLLTFGVAAARLATLRRRWRPAVVHGRSVLVADDVGPAVAGLWPPRVVIPGWALDLTESQQRLMLAHEEEHVRARDPWLLAWGTAALVLAPWNPALWWLLRRLRLAVEMDCDARVLGRGHGTHDYGGLLLQVGQHRTRLPLAAAALGEPQSFLERRIRRMAARLPRWRWLGAATSLVVAAAAIVAACGAPRPVGPERAVGADSVGTPVATDAYSPNADYLRRLARQYHPDVFTHPLPGPAAEFVLDERLGIRMIRHAAIALVFDERDRVVGHAAGVREAQDDGCFEVVDRLVPQFRARRSSSSGCANAVDDGSVVVYWKSLRRPDQAAVAQPTLDGGTLPLDAARAIAIAVRNLCGYTGALRDSTCFVRDYQRTGDVHLVVLDRRPPAGNDRLRVELGGTSDNLWLKAGPFAPAAVAAVVSPNHDAESASTYPYVLPKVPDLEAMARRYHPELFARPQKPNSAIALVFDSQRRLLGHAAGIREADDDGCDAVVTRLVPAFAGTRFAAAGCVDLASSGGPIVYWRTQRIAGSH